MVKTTQTPVHQKNKGLRVGLPHPTTEGKLTLIHPNVISIENGDTKRYLYRQWTNFGLELDEYTLVRILPLADSAIGSGWELPGIIRKAEKQGADALTAEERKMLADDGLADVQSDEQPERLRIEGRADLGRLRGITVLREEFRKELFFQLYIEIEIFESQNVEEWPKAGRFFILEDNLHAVFYLHKKKWNDFLDNVSRLDQMPELHLDVQGFVFRDESYSDLAVIYGGSTPAIINDMRYEKTYTAAESMTPSPEPSMQDVAKQMRGIKWSLWILASAVVLAALFAR